MIADEISTLGQQVYRRLYDRLMSGALLPGAKLTLRGLAEELGTSMQPIREAVSRLAAEGALELAPNRLIRVPCFSRAQTDELWSMRVLLEGYAAALFATRAESDEIARLVEINESSTRWICDPRLATHYAGRTDVGTDVSCRRAFAIV